VPNAARVEPLNFHLRDLPKYIFNSKRIIYVNGKVALIAIIGSTVFNVTRYFMDHFHPDQQAYFGFMMVPMTMLAMSIGFLMEPMVVNLTERHHAGQHDSIFVTVMKVLGIVTGFGIVVMLGCWLVGPEILSAVYGADLSPYRVDLVLTVLGGMIGLFGGVFGTVLTITRALNEQIVMNIISLLLTTVFSYFLIKNHSVIGGVLTFGIVNAINVPINIFVYRRVQKRFAKSVE
jgi:O-antigen/teichoic acid export membrane protein